MITSRPRIVFGFALLLAGCNWFGGAPAEPETESEPVSMTFQQLLRSGEDQACTFVQTDDGTTTNGTVFVAADGRNLRSEFEVTQSGGDVFQGFLIRTGLTGYVWTSQAAEGLMLEFPEGDDTVFGEAEGEEGLGLSENEAVDFTCEAWNIDPSLFEPPTDREFLNLSEQMEQLELMMDGTGSADAPEIDLNEPNSACGACDRIPDPQGQVQCRQALGC